MLHNFMIIYYVSFWRNYIALQLPLANLRRVLSKHNTKVNICINKKNSKDAHTLGFKGNCDVNKILQKIILLSSNKHVVLSRYLMNVSHCSLHQKPHIIKPSCRDLPSLPFWLQQSLPCPLQR